MRGWTIDRKRSSSETRRWPYAHRKKDARIIESLDELLKDCTAGDPMGGLRWTHKTTRNISGELARKGIKVSHVTVARLLHDRKYSLRTNRKRKAKTQDPERDRQFKVLTRRRRKCLREDIPIISIDSSRIKSVKK